MNLLIRDTNKWYLDKDPLSLVSESIISFIKSRAGKRILDFGCGLGGYSAKLTSLGFDCLALDSNEKYIEKAQSIGVNAHLQKGHKIDFPDNYFDSAIMIEVIEHLEDIPPILTEIKRVAKKNILITCPNCTKSETLQKEGLTFEHMLDIDHKHFFTLPLLREVLLRYFSKVTVFESEPIDERLSRIMFPGLIYNAILSPLYNYHIIKSRLFFRLYAEAII